LAWGQQGARLQLRQAALTDAPDIAAIMNSCVTGSDAFHGECGTWSERWAELLVQRRTESLVISVDGQLLAFIDIPPIRPTPLPLGPGANFQEIERYETKQRARETFRVTAAGIRADLLDSTESAGMFRRILYYGSKHALELGYQYAEALVPWIQHPGMPMPWTSYPGCELAAPPSISQGPGPDLYLIRWRLDTAVDALAAEGAGVEALDEA